MNIDTINTAIKDAAPAGTMPSSASSKVETDQRIQNRQEAQKAKESQKSELSVKDVKELTEDMNELMDDLQTSLGFSIVEDGNQVIVQITNRETNELIKQIPSEELLTIKEKMEEFTGLIFDQSV